MNERSDTVFESNVPGLTLIHQGKVRDIYQIDADYMLIVTSDRLSAFDVILPDPVPGKGALLTQISNFWFDKTKHIVPNHLTDMPLNEVIRDEALRNSLADRSIIVRRLKPLPIEAVVRNYLIGSGWKDYQNTGAVCGIDLPDGLEIASRLPHAIYTPATKADVGDHDENISIEQTIELLGEEVAIRVRDISLELYGYAAKYAAERGIIIADTKFEFGLDDDDTIVLIDEALTPDSSRFWPAESYRSGENPPSFDKQFVRDYLERLDWNKQSPGPRLPDHVLKSTSEKYQEAFRMLAG